MGRNKGDIMTPLGILLLQTVVAASMIYITVNIEITVESREQAKGIL